MTFYMRKELLLSARLSHRNSVRLSVCLSVRLSHRWICVTDGRTDRQTDGQNCDG